MRSAVNALVEKDENPNSNVVTETIKMLFSRSYGYQIQNSSRHFVTSYLNDEKTLAAVNNDQLKSPAHISDQMKEVELVQLEIEHKEPISAGFLTCSMLN